MVIPERIETERLVLMRVVPTDAEEIFYTYASKPACTRFVLWPTHQTIGDTRQYLNRANSGWYAGTDFAFSIRLKGTNRLLGTCGFRYDMGKIQMGYVLGPLHWGQGYATEVTRRLVQVLLTQPDVHHIGSFIDADNLASGKVLEKSGFVAEAVVRDWFQFPNQQNQYKDCIIYKYSPESISEAG